MITDLFLKTHRTPILTPDERAAFEAAVDRRMPFRPRQVLVRENVPVSQCTLVLSGFVQRFKDTAQGRRQVLAIHLPGDFVDLHSFPLKRLEHTVGAITAGEVGIMSHQAVRELIAKSPTIAELFWRSTMIDAATNREWLLSLGARSAAERLAHLFCELYLRLARIGMASDGHITLPLTQVDLAEATGLTPVHTNRMLRKLRLEGLLTFNQGDVAIPDLDALARFGGFDPSYLFFD